MRGARTVLLLATALVPACAGNPDRHTLAELRHAEPDVTEVRIEGGLDQAMLGYRKFLEEAPESALTPEAMRRLADLKLEKEYGILGGGKPAALSPPPSSSPPTDTGTGSRTHVETADIADHSESQEDFERRGGGGGGTPPRRVRIRAPSSSSPAASRRRRVRWRPSRSTTRSSPPIRTTSTTIRCSTRRLAPSTSSGASTRPSPSSND